MKLFKENFLIVLIFTIGYPLFAQNLVLREHWPEPSGHVEKVLVDKLNNRVVLNGSMRYIGKSAPFSVSFDSLGGYKKSQPFPNNEVLHVLPDGNGGRYVSGRFTSYGDSARVGIAHLDANGNVSSKLHNIKVNGLVNAMEIVDDTLYLGGEFQGVGKMSSFAGLSGPGFDSINTNFPEFNGVVTTSISDGNGGWYIAGEFTEVGDSSRLGLVQIDSSFQVTNWKPLINGDILAMLKRDSLVFIGGDFGQANGVSRENIAVVHAINGDLHSLAPSVDRRVHSFATYDSLLFIGGYFDKMDGVPRSNLGAWNIYTNSLSNWSPNPSNSIYKLDTIQSKLIIGGGFYNIDGQNRSGLASYNLANMTITSWDPQVSGIRAMALSDTSIFVSGSFSYVGSVYRKNFAEISLSTGLITNSRQASMHCNNIHVLF